MGDECLSILQDPAGCRSFREFLLQAWCVEIIDFWIAIELLEKVHHSLPHTHRRDLAIGIYTRYCSSHSDRAINMSERMRGNIRGALRGGKYDAAAFLEAQQHIYKLLSLDCFVRFKESPQYTLYISSLTGAGGKWVSTSSSGAGGGGGNMARKLLFKSRNALDYARSRRELKASKSQENLRSYGKYIKQQKKDPQLCNKQRRRSILVSFGVV